MACLASPNRVVKYVYDNNLRRTRILFSSAPEYVPVRTYGVIGDPAKIPLMQIVTSKYRETKDKNRIVHDSVCSHWIATISGSLVVLLGRNSWASLDGPSGALGASLEGRMSAGPVKRVNGVNQMIHLDRPPVQLTLGRQLNREPVRGGTPLLKTLGIVTHNYFSVKEIN